MNIHVDGDSLQELQHKLGIDNIHPWIGIDRAIPSDFGRGPQTEGYVVGWNGGQESFKREVGSTAELLEVLRPILAARDKEVKESRAAQRAKETKARKEAKVSLRAKIKELEEKLRSID